MAPMKTDREFLQAAHIEPCEIRPSNWMAWRSEEIENLRDLTTRQGELISLQGREVRHWKAVAILGWLFAAMLFSIPIIERCGQ